MVLSLDDFEEESGSVFNWLREDLQQVALVVVVDKDLQFSQFLNVLQHLDSSTLEALLQVVVVSIGDGQELNTPKLIAGLILASSLPQFYYLQKAIYHKYSDINFFMNLTFIDFFFVLKNSLIQIYNLILCTF